MRLFLKSLLLLALLGMGMPAYADSLLLPVTLDRVLDSNGDPVPGCKIHVYDAGTTNDRDVFSDADLNTAAANPIICDSGGYVAQRYIGTGTYKLVVTTSADVTIKTEDNLPGPLDTSEFDADVAAPETPVLAKADNYTITEDDRANVVAANATGGDITITLLSAVTAGDGFRITVKNVGSTGEVTVDTTGGQTIDGDASFELESEHEAITLVSDGANWRISETGRLEDDIVFPLPRGYLAGLQLSNNASDSQHDIDIAVGEARDFANSFNFEITSTHVKRIDASWASGSGNGGLASGDSLTADTTYHVCLVDDGDGDTEAGFDDSIDCSDLLDDTGGTLYRRIGSVITDDSSNILAFIQNGDAFLLGTPIASVTSQSGHTSPTLRAVHVPTGLVVEALLTGNHHIGGQIGSMHVAPPAVTSGAATGPTSTGGIVRSVIGHYADGVGDTGGGSQFRSFTNDSAQVNVSTASGSGTYAITTRGWYDTRGRDD